MELSEKEKERGQRERERGERAQHTAMIIQKRVVQVHWARPKKANSLELDSRYTVQEKARK